MITLTVVALRGPLKKKWHSGELQEKKAFRLVGGDLTYSFPTETGDSKHESSGIYAFDLLVLIVFFLHYEGGGNLFPLYGSSQNSRFKAVAISRIENCPSINAEVLVKTDAFSSTSALSTEQSYSHREASHLVNWL